MCLYILIWLSVQFKTINVYKSKINLCFKTLKHTYSVPVVIKKKDVLQIVKKNLSFQLFFVEIKTTSEFYYSFSSQYSEFCYNHMPYVA
jgi:hypothetical protein